MKLLRLATLALLSVMINVFFTRAMIDRAIPPRVQAQLAAQEKEAALQIRAARLRDDYLALHPELKPGNAPINVQTTPATTNSTVAATAPAPSVTVTERPAPKK